MDHTYTLLCSIDLIKSDLIQYIDEYLENIEGGNLKGSEIMEEVYQYLISLCVALIELAKQLYIWIYVQLGGLVIRSKIQLIIYRRILNYWRC